MKLESKFDVDQTVYSVSIETCSKRVACPDCLGTKKWNAVLPSGEKLPIQCPSCTYGYEVRGYLTESEATGEIVTLTIGSVGYEPNSCGSRCPGFRYMCKETGVGAGRVYYEEDLYATRLDAEEALPGLVETRQREWDDTCARQFKARKSEGHGRMEAHYRAQIRNAKQQIEKAERRLAELASRDTT